MNDFTIRVAQPQDMSTVADIWTKASKRLGADGSDQWQYPVRAELLRAHIQAGNCWVIEDESRATIGTVTVDEIADPRLWTPLDHPNQAHYVHRLVLDDRVRGQELGSAILDWASLRAQRAGKLWLRLDAWTSNLGLHRYYLDHGFKHVRTIASPDVSSGVLFQRPAGVILKRGPRLTERDLPS